MSQLVLPNLLVNNTPGDANPVNANFVAIATIINGSLDQANFAPGAGLSTRLIAPDGGLVTAHFTAGQITAAKVAPGATIRNRVQAVVPVNLAGGGLTEVPVVETPALITQGGRVLVSGAWGLTWGASAFSPVTGTVTVRVNRMVAGIPTEVLRLDYQAAFAGGGVVQQMVPFPVVFDSPGAGSVTCSYRVTLATSATVFWTTPPADAGVVIAEEAA